jgi:hypothetical protein
MRVVRPSVRRSVAKLVAGNVNIVRSASALAALFIVTSVSALGATPAPSPAPHPTRPVIHLPTVPLHTEVVVEVNKKGQVVRVKSAKPSKVQTFNLQTYGNALQMWIRHPDGSATVGLYRVTYDYDPKTQGVTRKVAIISAGGSWGNDPGAAMVMIDMAKKQAAAAEAQYEAQQHKQQQEQNSKLPSLNQIRGLSTPKPTPAATLPPY